MGQRDAWQIERSMQWPQALSCHYDTFGVSSYGRFTDIIANILQGDLRETRQAFGQTDIEIEHHVAIFTDSRGIIWVFNFTLPKSF